MPGLNENCANFSVTNCKCDITADLRKKVKKHLMLVQDQDFCESLADILV